MSHGFLANFGVRRFPKGNEGKRVSSGYNRRRRLATRSSGKQQAERTAVRTAPIVCPEESPLARPQAQAFCRWGLTRRLRRGRWGCRPEGAVLSFEAKESTKESTRHGDYGKKALIAHFDGGARNVARNGVGQLSPALGARSCSPFSAVKMGGPFSLRCLSPLCSPAVGVGQTYPLRGDVVSTTGLLCRFNERRLMIPHSRRGAYAALAGLLLPSQ